jgi:hypothetical protein
MMMTDKHIYVTEVKYIFSKAQTGCLNDISINFINKFITQTEGVWEQGAQKNIWTEERWSDRRLEKTA